VTRLHDSGRLGIPVGDDEPDLGAILAARGFLSTADTEETVARDLDRLPTYELPEGYVITSLADGVDLRRLHRCLHRGFDHPEPVPEDDEALAWRRRSLTAPSLIPELNIVVVAPGGEYAAYCGSFHDPSTSFVQLEPVCTAPSHRGLGCGRAAVLEALTRAARLGVRTAYVGSGQRFYSALGFGAFHRSRWWRLDNSEFDPTIA
jgi:GNAT superfamily N-acetyltransferase